MGRSEIFPYWWTSSERSYDKKTGIRAFIDEIGPDEWRWRVRFPDTELYLTGRVKSQKRARAACRSAAKKGPPKP